MQENGFKQLLFSQEILYLACTHSYVPLLAANSISSQSSYW